MKSNCITTGATPRGRWGQGIRVACAAVGLLAGGTLSAGWKDYLPAEVIVGNQRLPDPATLRIPGYILVDPVSRKVFVVDTGNSRVLRYPSKAALEDGVPAEAVFGQPDLFTAQPKTTQDRLWFPEAAAIDPAGRLWVMDSGNYRVVRFDDAATAPSGSKAAQVLGQPDFVTRQNGGPGRMMQPNALTLDAAGRLWVSDSMGRRVLRFDNAASKPNGFQPDGVLGQPDLNTYTTGRSDRLFSDVADIVADDQGRLWVSDSGNGRILRFDNPASGDFLAADGVLGQVDFVTTSAAYDASTLRYAGSLAIGKDGTLHAIDFGSQRILRWRDAASRTNGSPADGVLGRFGFDASAGYPSGLGYVSAPSAVAIDPDGALWVTDVGEERALMWNSVLNTTNGATANRILGFTRETPVYRRDPLTVPLAPNTTLEDPVSGKFFVGDSVRVLRYASRKAAESGAAPEAALGRTKLSETFSGIASDVNLYTVGGLALDQDGRLWVSDPIRNRVVAFDSAATAPTGSRMSRVLGQPDFSSTTGAATVTGLRAPWGIALDAQGGLWVADTENNRVLRYDNVRQKPNGAAADGVLGQPDFDTADAGTEPGRLKRPRGLALDADGRLWIADSERNRVIRHDNPRNADPLANPACELGGVASLGPKGMYNPYAVAITRHGRLWVADNGFNRVLRFENALSKTNRAPADGVLGAATLNLGLGQGRSHQQFRRPVGLSLDANENLWVADPENYRLLRFTPSESARILEVGTVPAGKLRLQFHAMEAGRFIVQSSTDLRTWVDEATYDVGGGQTQDHHRAADGISRMFRVLEP